MIITREVAPVGFPECAGKFISYPCFVEAKLDGELGIFHKGKIYGKGAGQKCRTDFPASRILIEANKILGANFIWGELHYDRGIAGDLYKLASNYNSDDLNFTAFDYDSDEPLYIRRGKLCEAINAVKNSYGKQAKNIAFAPSYYCVDQDEYKAAYDRFTHDCGYEGVVVKGPNAKLQLGHGAWVKVKSKGTADLLVISADPVKERVGLWHKDDPEPIGKYDEHEYKELCGVKVPGSTATERTAMLGKIVEVEYLQKLYNDKGELTGLRNPIFKRIRDDKNKVSLK